MKNITKIVLLCFFVTAGVLLFQAQDFIGRNYDDNNPNIDQPTWEYMNHPRALEQDGNLDVITDVDGFDNHNIGIDYAEQHVSTNPLNPLQIFVGANGPGSPPQFARNTMDGGLTWTLNQPSYPAGTCCDPWSAYLANGTLVYASGVSNQYIYLSTTNGNSWTAPIFSVSGNDRNTVAAEMSGTGPYANYLYAAITPGNFSRSTDMGLNWTQTYSYSNTVPGTMIAVGPNGSTNGGCVMYVTNSGQSYAVNYTFHRSTDGGATFSVVSALNVAGYVGTYYPGVQRLTVNNARTRPYPMIAMDNSNGPYRGRLYLVYASNVPAGSGNKPDIILQYSSDQGVNWSSKITVNDNANPELSDQWFPAIWCENTTGKLYIKWYDTRENPASYTTGVWGTYSTTGGTTFAPNQRISNASFTYPCPACGPNQNCYRGDYDGMTANPITGYAVWYDARNCSFQTMGSYFPDYAMKVNPATDSLNSIQDSSYIWVSVPAVKLYSNSVKFTATVAPPPGTGTISVSFVNKTNDTPLDSLTSYPDSLRMKVVTSGNVAAGSYTITVKGSGPNGTPLHTRTVSILTNNVIGIHTISNEVPESFYLYQNYPNPFNPTTNIRFDISKQGNVKLAVYDIAGRQVAELINSNYNAGKYTFDFNAQNLATGVYFYRLETPEYTAIKKMILIK